MYLAMAVGCIFMFFDPVWLRFIGCLLLGIPALMLLYGQMRPRLDAGAFTMEGRTEITIEEMQNQSGEKMQAFQADFMAGLMSSLAKIVLAVPNLSDLMQQIMPMTGAPSGK